MVKESEILVAVRNQLKTVYPDYPVYLEETKENFKSPCFFLKMIRSTNMQNKFVNKNEINIYITFFAEKNKLDSLQLYDVKDTIIELFWQGMWVKTKGKEKPRHFNLGPISVQTEGTEADIIYWDIPCTYIDSVKHPDEDTFPILKKMWLSLDGQDSHLCVDVSENEN